MKNFKTLKATFASTLLFLVQSNAEDFAYTNTNGTLTITGYTGPGGAVTIPSTIDGLPVTRIGGLAFNNQSSVTSVAIPDSITSFESGLAPAGGAFGFCTGLTNLVIPKSVTNIGDYAFVFCTQMVGVYFKGNSPSLGAQVFQNNSATVFYLPGTTGWGPTFGGRPTAVWNQALDFTYTNNNGAITITGYTGTGGNVTIPSTIAGLPVTSIGGVAFQFRMDLTGITIPDSVTNIEDGVLSKFGGFGTFAACTGLTNVVIGKGVMHIGLGAFRACSGLTNVAIPESVISIGDWAFIFCSGLSKVTIGKSVTNIGNDLGNVFAACTNLVGVYFQGNEPLFTSNPSFASPSSFQEDDKATVYYLPNATGWGPTVEGRPAVLWNPQAQTNDGNFGVKQNRFGFNVAGTPDIPLVIEASTNLAAQSWAPLQSCTLTNGLIYFSDAQWTTYPNRVYRIRSP